MAISSQEQEESQCTMLDALYCEEQWEIEEEEEENDVEIEKFNEKIMLLEHDLLWEDEELITLFSKEKKERNININNINKCCVLKCVRKKSVEWMLMVNDYYGFSKLTAVLAVNYFDRFLLRFDLDEQPWKVQLVAVTCLSLAAKLEEPFVPLLLDLQVEGTKYMFEAKNIQKMEILVLTTLEWKMNPVTPLSFLDHIIRRLGLKHPLHWEFYHRCENLLISLLPDWRMVGYLPSELATATMLHVIDEIEPCNSLEYQSQLLSVFNIPMEKVNDCYELIAEKWSTRGGSNTSTKRKYEESIMNESTTIINETSNNMNNSSWAEATSFSTTTSTTLMSLLLPSSAVSSSLIRSEKKGRIMQEHGMDNSSWAEATSFSTTTSTTLMSLSSSLSAVSSLPIRNEKNGRMMQEHGMDIAMPMPLKMASLARVFVDVVASPR